MKRVLVVDDNRELAENLGEILDGFGWDAEVFEDPRRALQVATPGRWCVALVDVRMPHMDGIELYERLRAVDPRLPCLAMTAFAHDERLEAAQRAGVRYVLFKPVDPPSLMKLVGEPCGS